MRTKTDRKVNKFWRFLKRFFNVVAVLIILFLMTLCAFLIYQRATGQDVNLFGYRMFEVKSGSMEPTIMTNDIILSKKVKDGLSLKRGDIVIFKNDDIWEAVGKPQQKGSYLVHRIVTPPTLSADGKVFIVTLGDNNHGHVDLPTPIENVEGIYVRTLSSSFIRVMQSPWLIVGVFLALVAFVVFMRIIYTIAARSKARRAPKSVESRKEEIELDVKDAEKEEDTKDICGKKTPNEVENAKNKLRDSATDGGERAQKEPLKNAEDLDDRNKDTGKKKKEKHKFKHK